jgi:hypothetical protein
MNVVLVNLVAQYTKSSLRDIEQAIKLLQAINLTHKNKLYSLLIIFLIFCKIRHPDLFFIVKNKWPNIFITEKNELDRINDYFLQHFDSTAIISYFSYNDYGTDKKLKTFTLKLTLEEMLYQNGRKLPDTFKDNSNPSSPKGLIISHFQSLNGGGYSSNNPPTLKLSHYVDIVEQVGRLT